VSIDHSFELQVGLSSLPSMRFDEDVSADTITTSEKAMKRQARLAKLRLEQKKKKLAKEEKERAKQAEKELRDAQPQRRSTVDKLKAAFGLGRGKSSPNLHDASPQSPEQKAEVQNTVLNLLQSAQRQLDDYEASRAAGGGNRDAQAGRARSADLDMLPRMADLLANPAPNVSSASAAPTAAISSDSSSSQTSPRGEQKSIQGSDMARAAIPAAADQSVQPPGVEKQEELVRLLLLNCKFLIP